jgi:hypothetical protein
VSRSDVLYGWAAVGSRISGFHHDSASKLQSLMMALDEATELAADRPELKRPLDTAMSALKELHALLNENRALAKAPVCTAVGVKSLLERGAARAGVSLRGELPDVNANVAAPAVVQALSLLCDSIGGNASGARTIDVEVHDGGEKIRITLQGFAPAASFSDAIAIATWLVERGDGAVRSAPRGYDVELPLAQ